ncbi:DUF3429 domain-containing protein [Sphingomonas morindae]|uniref:DUF3429 domain-containing protein n=1 Tax=Sphingomonas morindae TaxID=1541170 RepID=A0ABY4X4H0_9SPHN|nr:DUF3429 domain-containing protein [Sphingomonas morindae]USI71789.1 DUF3429 domain-containing protein [Sphingomonas morindae]
MRPTRTDDRDPTIPALSLVFGYGPMLPMLIGAGIAWTMAFPWPIIATSLTVLWAGAILLFLSGVRRGLAFHTPGGERPVQMLTMLWLFLLGLGAFVVRTPVAALILLLIGYGSIAILDPIAARREEAPAHFARLRPPQMLVGMIGLAALLAYHLTRG